MNNKLPCGCDYEDCMCPTTEKEWNYLKKQVSRGRFDLVMQFLRDVNESKSKEIEELEDKLKGQAKQIFDDFEYIVGMNDEVAKYRKLRKKWCKE